jgi:hypothetical protein
MRGGPGTVELWSAVSLADYPVITVTREPEDGNLPVRPGRAHQPTSERVHHGVHQPQWPVRRRARERINATIGHPMLQRPSLFNYATSSYPGLSPQFCVPIAPPPGRAVVHRRAAVPVLARRGPGSTGACS